jgi:uncharacterized membrane protein
MDAVAITVGTSWTIIGLIIIGLAIPLVRGQVGRNGLYGVRFPQSFQSDDAWYAINRFGGKRLIIWAVPLMLVGIVCFFRPLQHHTARTLLFGFAPLIFVLIPGVKTWWFAQHYRPRE